MCRWVKTNWILRRHKNPRKPKSDPCFDLRQALNRLDRDLLRVR